jgi:hypothetical protein
MDRDRILGFPDFWQKTGIHNLIHGDLIVEKHVVPVDHSSDAALEKYVLSTVEISYPFHCNVCVHLLRFLGLFLGALPC